MNGSSNVHTLSEAFTGRHPFSEFSAPDAIVKIIEGERPDRPQESGLSDLVWDTTLRCWDKDLVQRPTMTKVVEILREWLVHFLPIEPTL